MPDGTLVLTGRAKDTIVLSSGENIIEPGRPGRRPGGPPAGGQLMPVGPETSTPVKGGADGGPEQRGPASEVLQCTPKEQIQPGNCWPLAPVPRSDERICGVASGEPFHDRERAAAPTTLKQQPAIGSHESAIG